MNYARSLLGGRSPCTSNCSVKVNAAAHLYAAQLLQRQPKACRRGPGYAPKISGRGREARKNGPYALNAPSAPYPGHCGSPVLSTTAAHPEGSRGRVGACSGPLRQARSRKPTVAPHRERPTPKGGHDAVGYHAPSSPRSRVPCMPSSSSISSK